MVNHTLPNNLDTVFFNQSSNHTETFHIFVNFSIKNNTVQFIQPNAVMIALYATFFFMLETLGNFLLYCIIIYEKYGMDPQKRTATNMLLSNMITIQILFNIIIMPILTFNRIFGPSKYHFDPVKYDCSNCLCIPAKKIILRLYWATAPCNRLTVSVQFFSAV